MPRIALLDGREGGVGAGEVHVIEAVEPLAGFFAELLVVENRLRFGQGGHGPQAEEDGNAGGELTGLHGMGLRI